MPQRTIWGAFALLPLALAQQIGKTPEVHPELTTQKCTKSGGCVTQQTSVVLDSLTHNITDIRTGQACINATSGDLNPAVGSSVEAYGMNCAIEGVNYADNGIYTDGDSMLMRMYLPIPGSNELDDVTPRVYLLDPNGKDYSKVQLLNQEITFTADVSNLPCGMNGALYLSAMNISGGRSELNPAGATYGTGYCDAQCYNTSAFLNGIANIGHEYGACCNEMDLWEANAVATQLTPHSCSVSGFYPCQGAACGANGVCDKDGCGINPYGLGNHNFYGYGDTVDTTKPFKVVTQFITSDGTDSGCLTEIRRMYKQDGKTIHEPTVEVHSVPGDDTSSNITVDSITSAYCTAANATTFQGRGGLEEMGQALGEGMVLIFAIWNDPSGNMTWLDSGSAGPCNATQGNPAVIQKEDPGTSVRFSAIKWGDIGTTSGD